MATDIRHAVGRSLRWVQPRIMKNAYELRAGNAVVATLHFRNGFGSLATGTSGDRCWTFKRQGFLTTRVTVRVCGSDRDLGVFHNNSWKGGGTLELKDGRRFRANTNFWRTKYGLRDDVNRTLVSFDVSCGLRLSSTVVVHDRAEASEELPWLVMLGWYVAVMSYRDSAAAAATWG